MKDSAYMYVRAKRALVLGLATALMSLSACAAPDSYQGADVDTAPVEAQQDETERQAEEGEAVQPMPAALSEEDFPGHVSLSLQTPKGIQVVDAEVVCPREGYFTSGRMALDSYSPVESRQKMAELGFVESAEDLSVPEDENGKPVTCLTLLNIKYPKDHRGTECVDAEAMQVGRETSEGVFGVFGTHDCIVKERLTEWNGRKIYEFSSVWVYDSLVIRGGLNGFTVYNHGEVIGDQLLDMAIMNYSMYDQKPVSLMPLEGILDAYEKLLAEGLIQPVSNGSAIEKMELCYWMTTKETGEVSYRPVWDFRHGCVYDETKQDPNQEHETDAEHRASESYDFEHRHVVLDAGTGELVEYNQNPGRE